MTTTGDTDLLIPSTADGLKKRFKGVCGQINNAHRNWQIRVHRSISWLKRAGEFGQDQTEAKFLFLWIALNSLYSRWSADRNAPDADSYARREFVRKVCEMDSVMVGRMLRDHRGLVKKLLLNPFLAEVFWREPEHPKAKGWATEDSNFLDRNLRNGDACRVLGQVLDRLFVLRGQIVHGASTGGSQLNRKSLGHCLLTLETFVPIVQQIIIDKGCNDDWPELCYPPLRS